MSKTVTFAGISYAAMVMFLPHPYGVTVWGVSVIIALVWLVEWVNEYIPRGALAGILNAFLYMSAVGGCVMLLLFLVRAA
ncbi:MAG: hypothetical protein KAJ55_11765 [Anaerolineales bacterium]|nr:hypothetical protein [Anaerolineales bacterium]